MYLISVTRFTREKCASHFGARKALTSHNSSCESHNINLSAGGSLKPSPRMSENEATSSACFSCNFEDSQESTESSSTSMMSDFAEDASSWNSDKSG